MNHENRQWRNAVSVFPLSAMLIGALTSCGGASTPSDTSATPEQPRDTDLSPLRKSSLPASDLSATPEQSQTAGAPESTPRKKEDPQ